MHSKIFARCLSLYRKYLRFSYSAIGNMYFLNLHKLPRFTVGGQSYEYFFSAYNITWWNERCVEIPIVWAYVEEALNRKQSILEVGNVLSHYFDFSHTTVDKYECALGVINEDVVTFEGGKYDLIVSISTLEHVGWDEREKDPHKIRTAVNHLKNMLRPGGRLVMTIPANYSPYADQLFVSRELGASEIVCMERGGVANWRESIIQEVAKLPYKYNPVATAQGLFVAIISN